MQRAFRMVDVFTEVPYRGNPVAVVLDAAGLDDGELAGLANWTNLSETAFVLPPTQAGADYRVRIFTTAEELPFAGHPTLGTCHAWLAAGGRPAAPGVVVQECGAGLVRLRRDASGLAFAAPPVVRGGPVAPGEVEDLATQLGADPATVVDAQWVDNGPGWVALLLARAADVLALDPRTVTQPVGVVGARPEGGDGAFEVRTFLPRPGGVMEDPVTGSFNASVAQWLLATGRATAPYTACQGSALGRSGRVRIAEEGGQVWVGGGTVTCVEGTIEA